MQYFTSDTHFYHEELLGDNDFAPRPFADVETMNQAIIDHWNARVTDQDTVYHLGDVSLYFTRPATLSYERVLAILVQLQGKIVFIKGNHDSRAFFKYLEAHDPQLNGQSKFEFHDVGVLIKYNHGQYYMTHYPMMMGIVKQIINLHGHIHHYAVNVKENINVGVDTPEVAYIDHSVPFGAPFSLDEIEQMVTGKAIDFAKRH